MFFRFAVVVAAIVAIALAGIALEKGNLSLRRAISLQEYRHAVLLEERARLRVRIESLSAPRAAAEPTPLPARP